MFKKILLKTLKLYKLYLSPAISSNACRFYPSCSTYMHQAIRYHGVIIGLILGCWRILRCNPFNLGGIDEVPKIFRKNSKI